MTEAHDSQLGKGTVYDSPYNPELLFPLSREQNRASLNLSLAKSLPFHGEDLWTCYELSWLDLRGKPCVGIAYFRIPADSPFMIESKSFKLYLNSLNHAKFENMEVLSNTLVNDLSKAAGSAVTVNITGVRDQIIDARLYEQQFECVDDLELDGFEYLPNASLLSIEGVSIKSNGREAGYEGFLSSHLLRSNCPVTGQPDWGSVYVKYRGREISHESFLRYIISFRQCQDFHEHCVERIFTDLMKYCECDSLSVYARYTRRGGLDINPYRATSDWTHIANDIRTARQ
jgi:7-cyano-7-deazaguanine reductase